MATSAAVRRLLIACAMVALPLAAHAATAGDPAKGEAYFKTTCSACHSVVDDGKPHPGPLLKGVVGRKAGSWPGFKGYSPALKAWGQVWTSAGLDQFLTNPSKMVPGTFMAVQIADDTDRRNVVAYLTSLK